MLDNQLLIKHKETSIDLLFIGAAINRHIPDTANSLEITAIIDNRCKGLPLEQKAAIMTIVEDIRKKPDKCRLSRGHSSRSKDTIIKSRPKTKDNKSFSVGGVVTV